MKPTKTKAQIREELSKEVDRFLKKGGRVDSIPRGISGNEGNINLFRNSASFEPRKDRTPLTDIVNNIESRKHPAPTKRQTGKLRRPKKKLVTDDFGEPVRWIWVDQDS